MSVWLVRYISCLQKSHKSLCGKQAIFKSLFANNHWTVIHCDRFTESVSWTLDSWMNLSGFVNWIVLFIEGIQFNLNDSFTNHTFLILPWICCDGRIIKHNIVHKFYGLRRFYKASYCRFGDLALKTSFSLFILKRMDMFLKIFLKPHILCFTETRKSYGFGTT